MLVSPIRACATDPFDRCTAAATPTIAQDWAVRLNFS
jgi:hypothetical protein